MYTPVAAVVVTLLDKPRVGRLKLSSTSLTRHHTPPPQSPLLHSVPPPSFSGPSPEAVVYAGGRDGLGIAWDLNVPTRKRSATMTMPATQYPLGTRHWLGRPSHRAVLGGASLAARLPTPDPFPFKRQWEPDVDVFRPGQPSTANPTTTLAPQKPPAPGHRYLLSPSTRKGTWSSLVVRSARFVRMWDPCMGKRIGKPVAHSDNFCATLISEDWRSVCRVSSQFATWRATRACLRAECTLICQGVAPPAEGGPNLLLLRTLWYGLRVEARASRASVDECPLLERRLSSPLCHA
ncbi:hypothetical protein BC826DRAFT_968197 [Russula brevipes]|nr:hypothetical protein BC826DRAFT_968197 [Russula brevipes]